MELTTEEEIKLLELGMYLATKEGQDRTNAIIIEMGCPIKVLTDFGNTLEFNNAYDLLGTYSPSNNWIEAKEMDYPFPSIPERIQDQIDLLTKAKELYELHK